jgi:hypothetical protein
MSIQEMVGKRVTVYFHEFYEQYGGSFLSGQLHHVDERWLYVGRDWIPITAIERLTEAEED